MQELLDKVRSYLPPDRIKLVEDALEYALELHTGQMRMSGEAYIVHPIHAATFLAALSLDANTIAAALLHDVVEDCGVSLDELRNRFGPEVASLVDGVTKLTKLDLRNLEDGARVSSSDGQAESLR